jgi:HEAT repeat protein
MQSSLPERKPHPRPHFRNAQTKVTSTVIDTSGELLLRVCRLLLGATFVIVFGSTLFIVLLKEPNSPSTEPEEQMTAVPENETSPPRTDGDPETEASPADPKTAENKRHDCTEETARILGRSSQPSHHNDVPSLANSAPPLPPPPLKVQLADPPQQTPQLPTPPKSNEVGVAFEQRLQASEEDLRKQLLAVPELRLFSDLVVQNFRQAQKNDERTVRGVPKDQIDFAFNVQMNKYMRQAGRKEGLQLLSGTKCQLDPDTAMMVQTVSKDLRDMGFVSVPGTPARVRFKSPKERIDAFKEWCDVNAVEKFRGALATLLQMLQVEDVPTRLLLVRELAETRGPSFSAALATAALVDLSSEVRQAAVAALAKRPSNQYVPVLLQGFRYPWAPVADHAALALRKLKLQGVVPKLIALLDQPDPALPVLDQKTKKPMVRELVRLNHLRNCLLCHAPSANDKDGLVRGLVPTPGQRLPRLYYAGQKGNFVRADITFLRQDFSVDLPVAAPDLWPGEQRFDFVTRVRPARAEEMLESVAKPGAYPQRDAVLYALRGLTGLDGGDSPSKWHDLLGLVREK